MDVGHFYLQQQHQSFLDHVHMYVNVAVRVDRSMSLPIFTWW